MATSRKDSAGFVFEGTVRRTKAANVKAVTDKQRTFVVRVTEIVRAPEALAGYVGQDVTVKLAKGERVTKGQKALFYTNGWIFGENLAVQSVGHERARAARAVAADVERADPVAAAAQQAIRQCASDAGLVVSGKVIAVGQIEPQAAAGSRSSTEFDRISEHEPHWTEAVVEVQQVHKGKIKKKRVVVRFPASDDVRWSESPKFQVGHEGVFMLDADEVTKVSRIGAAAEALGSKEAFTCLAPASFQPAHCDEEIASVMDAVGVKKK